MAEMDPVLEVAHIAPVLPDIWFVQGRAYEDIKAGDSVELEVLEPSGNRRLARFKVVTTSYYGYLMEELGKGCTGGVTLVVQETKADTAMYEKQFRNAKFLFKCPA